MLVMKIFEGIPAGLHTELIDKYCQLQTFQNGDSIIFKDTNGQEIFFVVSGEASARISPDFEATFEQGSCFGEIAFIDGRPRTTKVTARADNTTTSFMLPAELERMKTEMPAAAMILMHNLLKVLATRLRSTDEAMVEFARARGTQKKGAGSQLLARIRTGFAASG
mgnify:CR=1 FL=1